MNAASWEAALNHHFTGRIQSGRLTQHERRKFADSYRFNRHISETKLIVGRGHYLASRLINGHEYHPEYGLVAKKVANGFDAGRYYSSGFELFRAGDSIYRLDGDFLDGMPNGKITLSASGKPLFTGRITLMYADRRVSFRLESDDGGLAAAIEGLKV